MAVTLLIIFTSVIGLIIWWYVELFKWNKHLARYPGPPPIPFIGNAHLVGSVTDVLPVFMGLQKKYGKLFKIFLGSRPRLILCDHKAVEFLLGSTTILEKGYDYKFLHVWLGTGLLTSSVAKWRRQRKLITPTFHFQILEQFIEIFISQSDILIKKLYKEMDQKAINIYPYINMCALDVICEAAMGTSVNAQNDSESEYVRMVKEMCRIVVDRSFSPIKMWDTLYPLTKDYQVERKALNVLHGYTNYVITKRREELQKSGGTLTNTDDTGIKKRLAFLDLLLQCQVDGQPLPNENIREEVDTFMFEGHDTASSGISFTLYLLSKHPKIQEKVVDELRSIFADDKNRAPRYQDLQDMKYLEMVIKESMRIFPPVSAYGRYLEEDVEFDGSILPKGLTLLVFTHGLHRNTEIFPDPEKFDPERFTLENSASRSPYAYVPFSAGSRNCIGQRFAMLEIKSIISTILRNFELLAVPNHEPILSVVAVTKCVNGLPMYLKKRIF